MVKIGVIFKLSWFYCKSDSPFFWFNLYTNIHANICILNYDCQVENWGQNGDIVWCWTKRAYYFLFHLIKDLLKYTWNENFCAFSHFGQKNWQFNWCKAWIESLIDINLLGCFVSEMLIKCYWMNIIILWMVIRLDSWEFSRRSHHFMSYSFQMKSFLDRIQNISIELCWVRSWHKRIFIFYSYYSMLKIIIFFII